MVFDTFVAMRIRHLTVACAGMLIALCSHGQPTWRKAFGAYDADEGACVRVTPEGDYLVVGSTSSFGFGSSDVYLLKIDPDGGLLWSKTYGGPQIDRGASMSIAPDGSVLIAGYTNGGGNGGYDGWLMKTDADGVVLWQRSYGGEGWDFLYDVEPLADGDWLLAGSTYSEGAGSSDGWLLRTNSSGDVVWSNTYGSIGEDDLRSAIQTSDGGFVLAGTYDDEGDKDALVIKLDETGALDWEQHIGGDSADLAVDVLETLDGGFSVIGSTRSYSVWNEHLHFKLSAMGDSLWAQNFGQINDQEAMEHVELLSGRFATVGYTKTSGGGAKDLFALLSESDGSFILQHTYGLVEDDVGHSIAETENGFVLCGSTRSSGSGNSDVYVIRCDSVVDTATEVITTQFDATGVVVPGTADAPLAFFPNPANGGTHLNSIQGLFSVRLHDSQGRLVLEWQQPVPQDLDLRGLSDGMYQLVTLSDKGVRTAQPLIISNH